MKMKKVIKRLSLILTVFLVPLLCSCVNVGGTSSGGGFDIIKFLQNKYVMIIGVLAIFIWMWSKRK
jgi:hypothetical protein